MSAWTSDELTRIGGAEELSISSLRRDGALRKPVITWFVLFGDDLCARSVHGRTAQWFRGVHESHEVGSGPAVLRETSPLSIPTTAAMTRSMLPTGTNTTRTPDESSTASSRPTLAVAIPLTAIRGQTVGQMAMSLIVVDTMAIVRPALCERQHMSSCH